MATQSKAYAATDENLVTHALAPTLRWLIAAALDGTTITYGEVKRRLEEEVGFSTIFPTRIGFVAGVLMGILQRVEPKVPLINVLVVSQLDSTPGRGAGPFMADRFRQPSLRQDSYKKRNPGRWRTYFSRAATEVYGHPADRWSQLYESAFGAALTANDLAAERTQRQEGNEDDYGAGGRKYGAGGEGEHHKALRLWVMENPAKISPSYRKARTETEFGLDSGDRVDAVYHLRDRTVVVEVKSRVSNAVDFRRGLFQCIKYRAVRLAMDPRDEPSVEAVLVTETPLPQELKGLLKKHKVRHYQVPMVR